MNALPPAKILIVDDDAAIRRLLKALLHQDFRTAEAASGEEALEILAGFAADLVLLDIMLPGLNGWEICRRLKSGPAEAAPQVMMVSAKSSKAEQLRAYEAGADDYVVKPFDAQEIVARVRLHTRLQQANRGVAAIRAEIDSRNSELKRLAEQRMQDIVNIQDVAVFTLAKVSESRDRESAGHLARMRAYSQILAEHLAAGGPYAHHIDRRFLQDLYRSSPLHDIGKVAIRDDILLKPGRLTPDEFEIMKQHAVIGADILDEAVRRCTNAGFLTMAAEIARYHHERFDGSGYPSGRRGREIPLSARIVALADVYDAVTSVRPYKPAFPAHQARQMIEEQSGRHFDPVVVDAFRACFADFLALQRRTPDDSPVATEFPAVSHGNYVEAAAAGCGV